jgi:excisionase family DNA binding protein
MAIAKLLLTPEEVAETTGTSKSWVYQKMKSGELPSVVLPGGRLLRVPAAALAAQFAPRATTITESGVEAE